MNEKYDVFISYNWKIKEKVEKLESNLKSEGYKIWRDGNELNSHHLSAQLARALNCSNNFICCITQAYCESYYCNLEFEYAIKNKSINMIVLMIEDLNPLDLVNFKIKDKQGEFCGIGLSKS